MKRFTYKNAKTLDEATALLKAGKAAVLAGGTDIVNVFKYGCEENPPETLIDIKNIAGLDTITESGGVLKIGACATLTDIAASSVVKEKYLALSQAAGAVAGPTLRNMGTIGGNICQKVQCWYWRRSFDTGQWFNCLRKGGTVCYSVTGDNRYHAILEGKGCYAVCPSDTAVALTALNATLVTNERSIPIAEFYTVLGNVLHTGEIIKEITVAQPAAGTKQSFLKFAPRPTIDFALVSAAAVITVAGGVVSDSRIVLGAVAPFPYRATAAQDVLKGKAINEALAEQAATAALQSAQPLSNNKYKVQIAKTLVKRTILA